MSNQLLPKVPAEQAPAGTLHRVDDRDGLVRTVFTSEAHEATAFERPILEV